MLKAIVFDGDDTLWHTERLYDDARHHARKIVEDDGLDGSSWEELERKLDVENVERLGHTVVRFPTSCAEAYDALCEANHREIRPTVRAAIYSAASTVFEREALLVPGAEQTLTELAARGLCLALLTKGDPELQRRRLEQSGLRPLFDDVEVVEQKTPDAIRVLLGRLGVRADDALTVGNSMRSDVLPSLEAGVQPVWIDAHVWEWERNHDAVPDDGVIRLKELSGLLDLVDVPVL